MHLFARNRDKYVRVKPEQQKEKNIEVNFTTV